MDLGGIGIPNINVMIVRASDEQASVNGIPNSCGHRIFMALLMLLVNDKYGAVFRYAAAAAACFVNGGSLDVVHCYRGIGGSG